MTILLSHFLSDNIHSGFVYSLNMIIKKMIIVKRKREREKTTYMRSNMIMMMIGDWFVDNVIRSCL